MKHRRPAIPQPARHTATASGNNSATGPADALPQGERLDLVALFNAARYLELENRARLLVGQHPQSGFAWKVLGASLVIQGKDGLPALQKAAALLPEDAEAHSNCGTALQALGRFDDAVASYRRALELKPDYAEAHSYLGNALQALGRTDPAVASYRRALQIKPDYAEAHNNLGNALKDLGRLDDAMASYRRALEIRPEYAEAHSNLGNALKGIGRPGDALASYRRALELKPEYAEAHNNLGTALQDLGRLDDAVAGYRRALELKPDYAEAYNNLGTALQELGRLDGALASYRRALEIKADYAEAHSNLGNALKDLGRFDDAVASYRRALQINPDFARTHSNLLFAHNYLSAQPAEMLLSEALDYGKLVARQARPYADWHAVPDADRCLRIGWVSADFRNHPVGHFVAGVLEALASAASGRLELLAYSNSSRTDALTERIKGCCHAWHPVVGLADERLAGRIRDDRIDILIDLAGHTADNCLPVFAWKPAPLQLTWLGYLGTTGVAAMDYLIADSWTLPRSEEANFTEKIWRLPESYLCFTPPDGDAPPVPPPAIANGYVTFGSFNNLAKINDAVVALWARVLAAVPNSRLLIKAKQLKDASVQQSVVERFAVHGIDAGRLILIHQLPRAQYLALHQQVDIALDPFPYPGITTTVESLWMGVPVLTLAGKHFVSRQGVGLLMNAGLPDWIAADEDDYVARAVLHAGDIERLRVLRKGLRQRLLGSPIFDAPRFARHFESALREMWTQWCKRQACNAAVQD